MKSCITKWICQKRKISFAPNNSIFLLAFLLYLIAPNKSQYLCPSPKKYFFCETKPDKTKSNFKLDDLQSHMASIRRVELRYSCFAPFMVLLTPYLARGQVTRPRSIKFMTRLLFDLDIRLIIASRTYLKSGPRFGVV